MNCSLKKAVVIGIITLHAGVPNLVRADENDEEESGWWDDLWDEVEETWEEFLEGWMDDHPGEDPPDGVPVGACGIRG